jgi:hypothetical protein
MASAPQANLPLFYNDLTPLSSRDHAKYTSRSTDSATWLANQHAIPLTSDEFPQAARHYPIVFSQGENPVPLALMGMNEGVNAFVDDEGKVTDPVYIPAYVRRYPYLLAKLEKDTETMSLCFDPSSELVGEHKDGRPLFDEEGKPSEHTQEIMQFCQRFEEAGQRTSSLIDELKKNDLLMDGDVAIGRNTNDEQPFVYRGFRIVNREKLAELRGDLLRTWEKNGLLMLVHAHLMSLDLMRDVFARQSAQGKGPGANPAPLNGAAATTKG